MPYTVGILALQGDFELHFQTLRRLSQNPMLVKTASDLSKCAALIIPGGESTTIRKLLPEQGLLEPLKQFASSKPVMGTCAGLILLSQKIEDSSEPTLGSLDITVKRNAYGRQINSFAQKGKLVGMNGLSDFEMVFIRAPIISRVGDKVEEIGFLGEQVVMVQSENILGLTFHPELTDDASIHQYFLNNFLTKKSPQGRLY